MKLSTVCLFVCVLLGVWGQVRAEVSPATCRNPSQDRSFCLECRDFYHLYEGQCYIDILGCESYVFGNICRKCQKGFILVNNECCDKVCMSKIYNEEHHQSQVAENKEEILRKAEVDGLQKSIAIVAKNSVKTGQSYDILMTKSQRFEKIFRYFVNLDIEGKRYTAINDYNIVTGEATFVDIVPEGEPTPAEITLTEDNIHGNAIYQRGYKFIYEKYGLQLYELQFSRMSSVVYGRSTQLKFIFVGKKVLLISIMVGGQGQPYVLWREEKSNVQQVKEYIQNLKKVESISKQYNFKQVMSQVLLDKGYREADLEIISINPLSQTRYIFLIYHKILRLRFKITGSYSIQSGTATLQKVEEVLSPKLEEMKEPEAPVTRVISKQSLTKSVEAKEVFDYLYKIQPSFRQNLVQNIKIEEGQNIKKIFIITQKDGKEYRMVVMKDNQSQQLQLIDEGFPTIQKPSATVLTHNSDGTTTITTSKIDSTKTQVKTVLETLKKNNIVTDVNKITSLQYTQGPKSTLYVAVLTDKDGNPTTQVTIAEDKKTKESTIIDYKTLESQIKITKPVSSTGEVIPASDFYKPEVLELISKVESKVEKKVVVAKVNRIEVTNTTTAKRYNFLVEDFKGNQFEMAVVQLNGSTDVEVVKIQSYSSEVSKEAVQTEIKSVRVDNFGVKTEYTNDQKTITSNQNSNIAITAIISARPDLSSYQAVGLQTKKYVQQQQQILILTNGSRTLQVTGQVQQKTLKYIMMEVKEVPLQTTQPLVTQASIPLPLYPAISKNNQPIKAAETVLMEKFKIFKNKVPNMTTVETLHEVEIVTFNYQIGQKKFVAVIQYNKTDSSKTSVLEVSPVQVTVAPVQFSQTTSSGKTVTTSNSAQEILKVNKNTTAVLNKVAEDYPLLKKYNISQISLTESDFSCEFEVTYKEESSKVQTTVTIRSDKKTGNITIKDMESSTSGVPQVLQVIQPPKVTIKEADYNTSTISKVIKAVNSTKISVDKVTKIVAETAPTYVTYNMQVQSSEKVYDVTVIDYEGTQEVVAIRSPNQTSTGKPNVKPVTVKQVDRNGNHIVKTNNVTLISSMVEITATIEQIRTKRKQTSSWKVDSVVSVDYGNVEGVTVTIIGPKPEDALTSTAFYHKETKTVQIVSIETVKVEVEASKEVFYGSVVPVTYPAVTIPELGIPEMIKTDQALSQVISNVQQSNSQWSSVVPSATTIQQLSNTLTQYTVVMESKEKKEQVVVVYNSTSGQSKVITSNQVKVEVKPVYVTQVETDNGIVIESNNVESITQSQPDFPQVLEYSDRWLNTGGDWSTVSYVQVTPSAVAGGSTVYKIETKTQTEVQTIEVSFNSQSKETSLLDIKVKPIVAVFPTARPLIKLDLQKNQQEVKQYTVIIEQSSKISTTTVKKVLSIEKQTTEVGETVRTEILGADDQLYYVTILKKQDQKPQVISVKSDATAPSGLEGKVVQSTDSNGNQVKQIVGEQHIIKNTACSLSVQTIRRSITTLKETTVVTANTVRYGQIQTVTLLFEQAVGSFTKATTIFNKTSNQVQIISVQTIQQLPSVTVEGEASDVEVLEYPTKKIPQVLVVDAMKTDKSLEKVVKTIQGSETVYRDILPVSVEVQRYSNQIFNYLTVVEVEGVRKQIVTLYNATSTEVKQISVIEIKTETSTTYSKEMITQAGEVVYSSNNVTNLIAKFTDLRFVLNETGKLIPEMNLSSVNVAVVPQETLNRYTIETVKGSKKVTVEVNYEFVSNRTYVTNYREEPIAVTVPTRPVYYPQILNLDDKLQFIDTIKNSGLKEVKEVINVLESKTTEYALYKETILKVETHEGKEYSVKVVKQNGEDTYQVIDASELPEPEMPSLQDTTPKDLTQVKTDSNGNTVTISTDEEQIQKNAAVNASVAEVIKVHPEYRDHSVKYIKTVNFGLVEEVMTTLFNPVTGVIDIQATSFVNKETMIPQIIAVNPVPQPTPQNPSPRSFYPAVVLSDSAITETIKKDSGLKTVLTTIQQSAIRYQSAVPLTVEVQPVSNNTTKYVIVLDVAGKKEQKVFTFDKESKETKHFATTIVPAVVKPIITSETVIDNQKATVSTSVDQIKKSHPETVSAVEELLKEKPSSSIESVLVIPESNTSTVKLITQKENKKEYTINTYIAKEKSSTKLQEEVVKISDLAVPKPVILRPRNPEVIIKIPVIEQQVNKIISLDTSKALDTTKITSVTVSENTNVEVYNIRAIDANNKSVAIEIVYNPANGASVVVDVSEVKSEKPVTTTTETKQVSGVSEVTTTNTVVIKGSREYKQISDFVKKNHPEVNVEIAQPIADKTERYQRSVVKTVVLREETKTVQATYVLDQRTQTIVELEYREIPSQSVSTEGISVKPADRTFEGEAITKIIKEDKSVIETLLSISKVDPSLKSITPIFIEIKEYGVFNVIVIVYDTPDSNSRILTIFNTQTKEARVIDYSKISKEIESSKVVETTNEYGQVTYYTDTVTTSITQNQEFIEVITVADELIPSIKDKPIKGFETVTKGTGKEYKIVTVDKGVINQVILQFNNQTKEVVLISSRETSVATQVIQILNQKEVKTQQQIDLLTLQGTEVTQLVKTILVESPTSFAQRPTVVSGLVTNTSFATVYELTLETTTQNRTTVKITKEKSTNKIIVNNIQPLIPTPQPARPTTVTNTDSYGNVVTTTNDQKFIKNSSEIKRTVESVYRQSPQLSVFEPTSVTTATYGNIIQNTIVFTAEQQSTVQITSITNKTTQVTTILDSRIVPSPRPIRPAVQQPVRPLIRPVAPIRPVQVKPVLPVQVIPTAAIPIAIKKFPEIKDIIRSVETTERKATVQQMKIEEFSSVKKFTAMIITETGKTQYVYLYDKSKEQINLLETIPVPIAVKPVFVETSINDQGEEVTTSTSIEQISENVPELQALIDEITRKYSVDVTKQLSFIETKGTTVKQVKIVVQKEETLQTVFTCIANGTITKVVDVQSVPKAPFVPIKPIAPTMPSVEVTPEAKQPIEQVVLSNTVVKEHFAEATITTVQVEQTSFISKYQSTVVNKKGEKAVIQLVQRPGQPVEIVHITGQPVISVPKGEEPTRTEVLVVPKTGNKVVVTTDREVIRTDSTIRVITQNIIAKLPNLFGYIPVKAETITYGVSKQSTLIFATEGKSSVQVTVLLDSDTNKVDIINSQTVTTDQQTPVRTIPGSVVTIAQKRIIELETIVSQIETLGKVRLQIDEIQLKEYDQVKVYSVLTVNPTNPQQKAQVVFVYDKASKQLRRVQEVKISRQVKAVEYEMVRDNFGSVVIKSNDVGTVKPEKPEITSVLSTINATYGSELTKQIKTVQITELKEITEYKFVTQIKNNLQQVTVTSKSGVVVHTPIIKDISYPIKPSAPQEGPLSESPSDHPEEVDLGGEKGTLVNNTIENSSIPALKDVEIVSIKSAENILATIYTVETKNQRNEKQVVLISVPPGGTPEIVRVQPIRKQVKTVVAEQSRKQISISQLTGTVVTLKTGTVTVQQQIKDFASQIIKAVPQVTSSTPVSVKMSDSGEIAWTTVVFSDDKDSLQVTSLFNKTDRTIQVIDKKHLNKTIRTASDNLPETQIYLIPSVAIPTTSKRLPEVSNVVKTISELYKKAEIESIEIEVFEQTKKIVAVVQTQTGKVEQKYLVDIQSQKVKLVETVAIAPVIKGEYYSETTNKYGEKSVVTNNVTELTKSIPVLEQGVKYIKTKYPVLIEKPTQVVKVIEYEREYKVNYISEVQASNAFAVVVTVDKETGKTNEITTYSENDIKNQKPVTRDQIQTPQQQMTPDSLEVNKIVKYIEASSEIKARQIQNVTKATKTTTVFGTEVVTLQAITNQKQVIKTVVYFNPANGETSINSFEVLKQPTIQSSVITEFKVDTVTGTKITVTNDSTVLASSEMMTSITEKVKSTDSSLSEIQLSGSTTTEYSDKVKVVSIFTDKNTQESVQVVSIFNKQTSEVTIIQTERNVNTQAPQGPRFVFNPLQLPAVQITYPSIPATTVFVHEKYPQYETLSPASVIVEPLEQVEFVTYIYERENIKQQVVLVYDKTTKESKVIEVNPVKNVKPFFYEEKKSENGDNVIVTNNLTEVNQRIPQTDLLTKYLDKKGILTQEVEAVQLTVSDQYLDYTLVVKTSEEVRQYEYLVNTQTKQVQEINSQVVSSDLPIVYPQPPVVQDVSPSDDKIKPVLIQIIDSPENNLNNVDSIINMTKQSVSKGTKFEIEYTTESEGVNKLVVLEDEKKDVKVIDERPIEKDYVQRPAVVVEETVDEQTKSKKTVYPNIEAFKLDEFAQEITQYLSKAVSETNEYKIESIRKESFGYVQQYDILLKADKKAPIQVTVAKDTRNKNIMVLEKKKITEEEVKSVIEGPASSPTKVEVSDIEKENIKVLSKLGLVKDIKEFKDVGLEKMANNEQFRQAVESVKHAYTAILNNAVIVKILEKKSLESNSLKVFYKAKDQIYQASLQLNEITGETKLTEFIKVGTREYPKSEVNVYSDLCYGYQVIEDFSLDSNLDFITSHLKQKYDGLKDASLIEAQEIVLQNGRINYKLYYKKDGTTVKYIVYYEPEYKRILEVKGTNFEIGNNYRFVDRQRQIADPYFRKLDTYIRQNRNTLGSASVMYTESNDNGQQIQFRTVYSAGGKTYRSIAAINKDNQNIDETSLTQVIEIPVEEEKVSSGLSECNTQTTKLDIHDLGKNPYFTECYKYIQEKYQEELLNGQLLGASEQTSFNIYTYVFYFIIDETKIITLTIEFDPLNQATTVTSEPASIDLQNGYYPMRSDQRLTFVRNWLKDNNPDLSSSVLVSSMAKKFYFGTLYKVVFKVTTKFIVYIAYVECGSKQVKIYDSKEVDNFNVQSPSAQGTTAESTAQAAQSQVQSGETGLQAKLKGFARPNGSTKTINPA